MTRASLVAVLAVAAFAARATADDGPAATTTDATPSDATPAVDNAGHWGAVFVPRFTYSSDDGAGLGVRGSLYWYRWDQRPYKTAISFQAFATTNLVQHHFLKVDALDAFNVPLRLTAEVGFYETLTFNYCDGACVRDDDDRSRFLARYLKPYGAAIARWRLGTKPVEPSVFGGWRGDLYIPGVLFDGDGDGALDLVPYPGSRYAARFPQGEPGFASVFLAGAAVDGRDDEPDPSRGYYVEASLRGAAPFTGSSWTFGGVNAQATVYAPLLPARRLVLASRVLVDALVGDPPTVERAQVGGAQVVFAFGGADLGRGVRQQRYFGLYKAAVQNELRTTAWSFSALSQDVRIGGVVFVDAGVVGDDLAASSTFTPHLGTGVGFRLVWNDNFVMRIDVAVSPDERYAPALYTKPEHAF